jgi:T5SS/PEP-CTERM-associated repeat protein
MSFADLLTLGTAKTCKTKFIKPTIAYERGKSMKTKFTSETSRILIRRAFLLIMTALSLQMSAAFGATTTWTDGIDSWFVSADWSSGKPDSATDAQINNGGTAQIYTDFPMANALSLTLGLNAGDSGAVEVSPGFGDLDVVEAIFVGKGGVGKLTITQGTVNSASASIASLAGELWVSSGSATVDGGGSSWIISGEADVGGTTSATGLLTVINSGTVTAANVHVWDSGTLTGNGTISTTNETTVDGTLAPKGGGTALTIGGNLSLTSGATHGTTQCNVTPQDPSTTPQVSVSAQVSLGGLLLVTMSGDFSSAPTRFTLLSANSVAVGHPTFDFTSITYPTGHCWHPAITYDSTNHFHVYLDRVYDCT